jgi:hypothetical protein
LWHCCYKVMIFNSLVRTCISRLFNFGHYRQICIHECSFILVSEPVWVGQGFGGFLDLREKFSS